MYVQAILKSHGTTCGSETLRLAKTEVSQRDKVVHDSRATHWEAGTLLFRKRNRRQESCRRSQSTDCRFWITKHALRFRPGDGGGMHQDARSLWKDALSGNSFL